MSSSHTTVTIPEAISKLEYYCAYQERCEQDVLLKLAATGLPRESFETVVSHLKKENYLNETRFACTFAIGKFNIRKWGRQRISAELSGRGIPSQLIDQALTAIDAKSYRQTFDMLAKKRWSQIKEKDILKRKRKLASYLLYRGWETELVYGMLNSLKA